MSSLEVVATRGFYRPAVVTTFNQAVEQLAQALQGAREQQLYAMMTRWLRRAGHRLRVALVARPGVRVLN